MKPTVPLCLHALSLLLLGCFDGSQRADTTELDFAERTWRSGAIAPASSPGAALGSPRDSRLVRGDRSAMSELADGTPLDTISASRVPDDPTRPVPVYFFQDPEGNGRLAEVTARAGENEGEHASPSSPAVVPDQAPLTWVAENDTGSLRLNRALMDAEVQKALPLLLPDDHRFAFQSAQLKLLPGENLVEVTARGRASVPFVQPKDVSITIKIRPQLTAQVVRLTYVGMSRTLSGCALQGPVCFMLKRAIDQHIDRGQKIQAFLDQGVNAMLRPLLAAAAATECASGHVGASRVHTEPDFVEIVLADSAADVDCLRSAHALRAPGASSWLETSRAEEAQ